jgi:hypothetical protein
MPTTPGAGSPASFPHQIGQLAFGPAAHQHAVVQGADPGAVIAAIFHPPRPSTSSPPRHIPVKATTAQRATISHVGQPKSSIGIPDSLAKVAATIRIGAQTPAMNTCIESALPCPALARLATIIRAKKQAETSGRKAAAPSKARLGRRIIATPTSETAEAAHTAGRTFSPSNSPASTCVNTGARKPIAMASASGIR